MLKTGILLISCMFLLGCTVIDISNVPLCGDINKTGTDCHSPNDALYEGTYDYSNAVCKEWQYAGTSERMIFCFDTLEDSIKEFGNEFNKSINLSKCYDAGDCARNMLLDGCSYDGCNFCCNNECTLMECKEESINISKLNFSFERLSKPTNEKIPKDYIQITIYETICQCVGYGYCEGWECSCDEYCYNKSKMVWIPKNMKK